MSAETIDLLLWERDVEVGDEVEVRFGHGLGFAVSAPARVLRINRASFRVALLADVSSPYKAEEVGWVQGQEIRVSCRLSERWHPWDSIFPPAPIEAQVAEAPAEESGMAHKNSTPETSYIGDPAEDGIAAARADVRRGRRSS